MARGRSRASIWRLPRRFELSSKQKSTSWPTMFWCCQAPWIFPINRRPLSSTAKPPIPTWISPLRFLIWKSLSTLTLANCLISGLVWPMPGGRWMQPRRFSMESLFLKSQRSSRHRLRPHLNSGPRNSASKDCPSVPRGPVCPTVRHDAVAAVACSIS